MSFQIGDGLHKRRASNLSDRDHGKPRQKTNAGRTSPIEAEAAMAGARPAGAARHTAEHGTLTVAISLNGIHIPVINIKTKNFPQDA
ncbi:hypothetical protein LQ948_14750 [Jiella sp. MQZ9-1]|uniref:Uncharacterized protein n=1 Tax=Jiella flava TaxID=2816857 RepID=A0A939FXN8_9HYPH|nr:hypothetical protein [Jiella flava]MBO0663893.1 hypothetical protein [Jiella flava]MCD2472465.1 hypothetical protein [Jiella flava]